MEQNVEECLLWATAGLKQEARASSGDFPPNQRLRLSGIEITTKHSSGRLYVMYVCITVVRIHFVGAIFILILHRYRIALFRGILFTQVMGP